MSQQLIYAKDSVAALKNLGLNPFSFAQFKKVSDPVFTRKYQTTNNHLDAKYYQLLQRMRALNIIVFLGNGAYKAR